MQQIATLRERLPYYGSLSPRQRLPYVENYSKIVLSEAVVWANYELAECCKGHGLYKVTSEASFWVVCTKAGSLGLLRKPQWLRGKHQ